jgi:hypothetical protein
MLPPRNDADTGTIAASHEAEAVVLDFYCHQALRKSSGSSAIFVAIRRASSCNRVAVRIAVACAASAACGASACAVFCARATLPRSTAAPLGKS